MQSEPDKNLVTGETRILGRRGDLRVTPQDQQPRPAKLPSEKVSINLASGGFPGGAVVENLPANAEDAGSSPGLGRSHTPRSN